MNGKNYLVAVLLCSMILALAFTQNSGSQTTPQYDPWVDLTDDGYINVKDAVILGAAFGTTGDPTKNVNVTNWPKWLAVGKHQTYEWAKQLDLQKGETLYFETRGYERVTIAMRVMMGQACRVYVGWWVYNETGPIGFLPFIDEFFLNGTYPGTYEFLKTYYVQGTHMVVEIDPYPYGSNATIFTWVYMTT